MDTRRGCNSTPDEERWLFVGRDPCCPPSPEHRGDPGALFDEVEKGSVAESNGTDRIGRPVSEKLEPSSSGDDDDSSDGDSSEGRAGPFEHEQTHLVVRPRRAALPGIQKGKFWDWIFGKFPGKTRLQYVRAGTWSIPEATRVPPAGGHAAAQALFSYLSFGICRDECLRRISSFCRPVHHESRYSGGKRR